MLILRLINHTCLSLKDLLCLPLAFCFSIIKFFVLRFSLFVVLANGLILDGLRDGFSRSARPSYPKDQNVNLKNETKDLDFHINPNVIKRASWNDMWIKKKTDQYGG